MPIIIIKNVKKSSTVFDKATGLIGKKTAFPFFLETRFGIHTFFLGFPIDIVILDGKNTVVDNAENLMPNRLFFWNPKYKKVLELPVGSIKRYKINLGDIIHLG